MEALGAGREGSRPVRVAVCGRDLLALTKPTITLTALVTCAGGYVLASVPVEATVMVAALVGTALAVASANAFNMLLERDSDGRMARTRHRPLPAGRLTAASAAVEAVVLGVAGVAVLAAVVNGLTAALAMASIVVYAFVYTPLKRRTPWALLVGALPGAAPPLLGWTAATGRLEAPGLALFGVLFLWQIPHFLAIALRRREEYAGAGIMAMTVVYGPELARRYAAATSGLLIPASLTLPLLGAAGWLYAGVALALGTWMLALSGVAVRARQPAPWDRRLFVASLAYLPLLMLAVGADMLLC